MLSKNCLWEVGIGEGDFIFYFSMKKNSKVIIRIFFQGILGKYYFR